jgi:hypothetical protein
MKTLRLLLMMPVLGGHVFAGEGSTGFIFAGQDVSVREASLGEAGSADPQGADSLMRHPGGLGRYRGRSLSVSHASHVLSMSESGLAYAQAFDVGAAALGARQFSSGDITGYTGGDARTASFEVKDLAAGLAYGRPVSRRIALGFAIKDVRETIASYDARATVLDAGAMIRPTWDGETLPLQLAGEVKNMGSGGAFRKEKAGLPQTYVLGAAWRGFRGAVNLLADWRKPAAGAGGLNVGAELWMKNLLALRVGRAEGLGMGEGLTAGLGFRLPGINVDYAVTALGDSFGATHRVGLTFRFGGAGDKSYQEGLKLHQEGQHAEAILKFQQALDADPEHAGAVRALREAVNSLERSWPEGNKPPAGKSPSQGEKKK